MNFEWFQKWLVSLPWSFIIMTIQLIILTTVTISNKKLHSSNENLREINEDLRDLKNYLIKEYVWNCPGKNNSTMSSKHYMKERIVYYFSKYSIPFDDINFIFSDCSDCLTKENLSTITDIVFLQQDNFNNADYLILMNLLKQKYSR